MIDSHAHVAFAQFDADREAVIERAKQAGVSWVEVGTDVVGSQRAVALAEQYPDAVLGAAVGVHPSDVAGLVKEDWQALEQLLEGDGVIAVGEVGFDFYRGGSATVQQPVLERFVALARAPDRPVIFHVRSSDTADAHAALLSFLQHMPAGERPSGVVHTFSGTPAQAEDYLALGLFLSISGVVTFKNAGAMADVARMVPLDRLLIETDCPFLAPDPHRGQRNEPAYTVLMVRRVAELRRISMDEVQRVTVDNAQRLFGVKNNPPVAGIGA
ncbi:MAG: TatD family hydrolase [Candidatus Andersenbacteria bacterium]|nr:TatD family hydrolase [Candidatus Andersenbacteria bacterium]